jgi:flavin reductase (DIM6/NTAB) family NADH-FMN oxidoreductase RutF
MKKLSFILLLATANIFLTPCSGNSPANTTAEKLTREQIKVRSFADLFKPIAAKEIPEDVFTLVGEDFSILTSGSPAHYNSMVASWGGWGILFNKPAAFHILRSSRYTLELMRQGQQTYTMTFFDEEFKEDIMEFGKSSGRGNDAKMKNSKLTSVQTPAGNMAFKEAKIIVELKLVSVSTVTPDDFYLEEGRDFVVNANPNAIPNEYHKIVFGEITNVWIRK